MARNENAVGEGSERGKGRKRGREEGAKHNRYTQEQIEVLEKVYAECSNPNRFQRDKILREQPNLRDINNNQLKIWFQNRRFREKQKKENDELLAENRKLAVANRLLREENDCLQKKLTSTTSSGATTKTTTSSPESSIGITENKSLFLLAEETKNEFLSKAVGTAIKWDPAPMLKLPSSSLVCAIYVSDTCVGVAARARTTIPFEPDKAIEILKDRPSWSRNCRKMDVLAMYPTNNGGTMELIYTQYYAPTTMACARDFWTLRYTSALDDGGLVVCEKSISCSDVFPSSPTALEFLRGRMLASGYLIHPCEGGSIVHLVDHLDLEASSVPEVIRPLYESSELMAKNMIVSALHYIEYVVSGTYDKTPQAYGMDLAFLTSFSQKLIRGFNDAINGFAEDGWTLMNVDAPGDVIVSVKQLKNCEANANYDSVICMKASLLLQNVLPNRLVMLLKEHRSSWMDFNFADHSAVLSKNAVSAFPGSTTHNLSENAVLLGHTNYEDEILEVLRFDRIGQHENDIFLRDLYHLQVTNGLEDTGVGACSELIFAPIDRTLSNGADLLSSGFRTYLLGSNTSDEQGSRTLLTLAFQFPSETYLQEDVASTGWTFVQNIISSVKKISLEAMSSNDSDSVDMDDKDSTYAVHFAKLLCQSYRSNLGVELLGLNYRSTNSLLELIQHHPYAILCFSFSSTPVCLYANQSALNMLETTTDNLKSLTVDKILGGSDDLSLFSILPSIMQQGYAILPPGFCLSEMDHGVSYEQAVVWKVQGPDGSILCLTFAFVDWSFA